MQISLCDVIHKNTKKMCRYLKNILKQKSMHTMYIYIQYIYIYIYYIGREREREIIWDYIYSIYTVCIYIYRYSSIFISIHVCVWSPYHIHKNTRIVLAIHHRLQPCLPWHLIKPGLFSIGGRKRFRSTAAVWGDVRTWRGGGMMDKI